MDDNKTLIDILFDEENVDGITLRLDDGQEVDFEQIATIPLKSGANYAILKPTVELEGVADDEVMIFRIIDENCGRLELETDDDVLDEVYETYCELLDEYAEEDE